MSRRARKAFGGRRQLHRKRSEAEKLREARHLCRCSDHYEFFDSPAEEIAWKLTAQPIACEQCGREKLIITVTPTDREGAPTLSLDEVVDTLIKDFVK